MNIKYDEKLDAIYFTVSEKKVFESEEISKGTILDYDKEGSIVAIEILNFKDRKNQDIEIPVSLHLVQTGQQLHG
ncbi:MAG: DUF2283 domain-containing protein [Campylobacterales bacterium]|nr:DUF2283 domain-containing protein [Campylobacterales bacterium]